MRFTMRFCANQLLALLGRRLGAVWSFVFVLLVLGTGVLPIHVFASNVSKQKLQAVYGDGALYVSAKLQIHLDKEVEDALRKGVPLVFVTHAKLTQKRWYWYDKNVLERYRITRLSYVPLTREWQVRDVESLDGKKRGPEVFAASLNLRFATLDEALAAVQTISDWKIADLRADELDGGQYVDFDFRLDLTGLPKPFQLGIGGDSGWDVAYQGVAWPQHKLSPNLRDGAIQGVVAKPVEIESRSKGAMLQPTVSQGKGKGMTLATEAKETVGEKETIEKTAEPVRTGVQNSLEGGKKKNDTLPKSSKNANPQSVTPNVTPTVDTVDTVDKAGNVSAKPQ